MTSRRSFISGAGTAIVAGAAFSASARSVIRELAQAGSHRGAPDDEDFWLLAQQAFTMDRSVVNLNNGGVSPAPRIVQESMKRHLDEANSLPPPHVLWSLVPPRREAVRSRLARAWGVDAEEVAITRNSSESLQICQFGIDLKPGDEVLTTNQDYPRMLNTFRQREAREGVKLITFSLPVPCESENEIVEAYASRITPRTRMILCCHVINLTGQVLPVRRIAELGNARGIPVVIDGAHAFANLHFSLDELQCHYYGTSLHKWLFAPIGTGLLYVRRDRIEHTWPLMAADEKERADIRKFEQIGTHPAANFLAIAEALTFHEALGGARKEARLRALRARWIDHLQDVPGFRLNSPRAPILSCGLGNFRIDGLEPAKLQSWLWEKHRILVTTITHDEFSGTRVTPSVYTTPAEIDRFCDLVRQAARHGLPE